MKTLFIVNPVAGHRKSPVRLIKRIKTIYHDAGRVPGIDYEIKIWKEVDQIDSLLEYAHANDFKAAVAVGGDGTVHAIGTRLIGKDVALGIVPSGSGNGYAGHLGIGKTLDESITQTLNGQIVKVDTGTFGGAPFLNCAGFGMDAAVADKFSKSSTRGLRTYVQLGAQTFFTYPTTECTLTVDDQEEIHLDNLLMIDIMNGTEWGRGAKMAPYASITDGYMTIVSVEKTSVMNIARLLRLLFVGKIHKHPKVRLWEGKKMTLRRPVAGVAQVDGDPIYGLSETIEIEVIEKSLNVLIPQGRFIEV